MGQIGLIWILQGTLFLLPLFFLPLTADFYDFNKLALLVLGVLLAAIFWIWARLGTTLRFRRTPLDLPVLAFALVTLLAAVARTPNWVDAFLFPGTATVVLAGTLLYFLITNLTNWTNETNKSNLLSYFLAGGALSALVSLLAGVGLFKLIPGAPAWLAQPTFSTTGGLLSSMTLFIVLLPLAASHALRQQRQIGPIRLIGPISLILLLAGLATTLFHALPGKPSSPQLLPVSTGWAIAVEVAGRNPILGVGPGNFVEAFSRFRPVEYNATPVWNLRFSTSSNWPLHVLTTLGLVGALAFASLLFRLWTEIYRPGLRMGIRTLLPAHYSLLAAVLLLVLVPGNFLLLVAFYLLLGVSMAVLGRDVELSVRPNVLVLTSLVGVLAVVLYFGGRVFLAELSYAKALNAAARNEGTATYNALIKAINRNPGRDAYRITYSQVNLALANSIAGRGEQISEQDRQTISQLVQQAIREAKAAVALNQQRAGNWENLARVYQALIPFAQGADQWTVSSYGQAIALDPVNPLLRIAFGGVFYSLGQYDDAIRVFELAVAAKPDLANSHYNLAAAHREKGDTARSIREMEAVLQLVQANSQDYQIAQGELEALRGKLAEEKEATASGETLEVSETPTEPVLEPPLELGEEAAPPATRSASPSPSP